MPSRVIWKVDSSYYHTLYLYLTFFYKIYKIKVLTIGGAHFWPHQIRVECTVHNDAFKNGNILLTLRNVTTILITIAKNLQKIEPEMIHVSRQHSPFLWLSWSYSCTVQDINNRSHYISLWNNYITSNYLNFLHWASN